MSFKIIEAEQRSEMWYAARAGRVTGSRAADVLAKIKTGEAAARRDYRLQLAVERITGTTMDTNGFVSAEMQRGIDSEPAARARLEAFAGYLIRDTGFLSHDSMMVGCSLDGDVDNFEGIIELKAPKSTTHVGYLRAGVLPSAYVPQVTHNLWVSGATWCDFCSFDDRLPSGLDWFHVRVYAKDLDIAGYAESVQRFLAEVSVEADELTQLRAAA